MLQGWFGYLNEVLCKFTPKASFLNLWKVGALTLKGKILGVTYSFRRFFQRISCYFVNMRRVDLVLVGARSGDILTRSKRNFLSKYLDVDYTDFTKKKTMKKWYTLTVLWRFEKKLCWGGSFFRGWSVKYLASQNKSVAVILNCGNPLKNGEMQAQSPKYNLKF